MKIVCDGEHDVRSVRDSESETPRHRLIPSLVAREPAHPMVETEAARQNGIEFSLNSSMVG